MLNNQVYVAYALQDGPKHDPVNGAGNGVVDIFDVNGNFVKRFASAGMLNSPWGVAIAPSSFGQFSNAILVGNFGEGAITAFDTAGNALGQVEDSGGHVLLNPGLWDMVFGQTSADANTMYFTAGGADQTHGLFATLVAGQTVASGDFSLSVSPMSATVGAGGAVNLTVTATPTGGFNSPITLSCTAPAGVSCLFSPNTITPGGAAVMASLTLSVSQGYMPAAMIWFPFSGIGLFGLVFATPAAETESRRKLLKRAAIAGAVLLIAVLLLMAAGCSSGMTNHTTTSSPANLMVTGTSGSIMHSVQVALTVN